MENVIHKIYDIDLFMSKYNENSPVFYLSPKITNSIKNIEKRVSSPTYDKSPIFKMHNNSNSNATINTHSTNQTYKFIKHRYFQ